MLANVGDLGERRTRSGSAEFVERGGGLLVFTGDRVDGRGGARARRRPGLGVGEVARARRRGRAALAARRWERGRTRSSGRSPTPSTATSAAPRSPRSPGSSPAPSARVLAWFRGRRAGAARADRRQGARSSGSPRPATATGATGPAGRLYLPMVHQMVAYVAGLADGGRVRAETGRGRAAARASARPTGSSAWSTPTRSSRRPPAAPRRRVRRPVRLHASRAGRRPRPPDAGQRDGDADDRLRGDEIWPWFALTLVGAPDARKLPRQPHGGLNTKGTPVSLVIAPNRRPGRSSTDSSTSGRRSGGTRSGKAWPGRPWPRRSGLAVLAAADYPARAAPDRRGPSGWPSRRRDAGDPQSAGSSPRCAGGRSRGRPPRSRAGSRSSASGSARSSSTPASPRSGSTLEGVTPSLVERPGGRDRGPGRAAAARHDRPLPALPGRGRPAAALPVARSWRSRRRPTTNGGSRSAGPCSSSGPTPRSPSRRAA